MIYLFFNFSKNLLLLLSCLKLGNYEIKNASYKNKSVDEIFFFIYNNILNNICHLCYDKIEGGFKIVRYSFDEKRN